jgi:hypothetical protein
MLGRPHLRSRRDRRWTGRRICSIAYLQVKNMPRPSIAMTSSSHQFARSSGVSCRPDRIDFGLEPQQLQQLLQVAGWSAWAEHVRRNGDVES